MKDAFTLFLCLLPVSLLSMGGPMVLLLLPLPAFTIYVERGVKKGIVLIGVAFFLASIVAYLVENKQAFSSLGLIVLSGITLGELRKRRFSIEKTIILATLIPFLFFFLATIYQSFQHGQYPWDFVSSSLQKKLKLTVDFLDHLNRGRNEQAFIQENFDLLVSYFTYLTPSLLAVSLAFAMWLNLLLGQIILKRRGISIPDLGDLSLWRPPENMVWFLIGGGIMLLLPYRIMEIIGGNIVILMLFAYFLAGVAIVRFFLKKANISLPLRIVTYVLIFLQQFVTVIVTAIGLFDLWFDFRKLNKKLEDSLI